MLAVIKHERLTIIYSSFGGGRHMGLNSSAWGQKEGTLVSARPPTPPLASVHPDLQQDWDGKNISNK